MARSRTASSSSRPARVTVTARPASPRTIGSTRSLPLCGPQPAAATSTWPRTARGGGHVADGGDDGAERPVHSRTAAATARLQAIARERARARRPARRAGRATQHVRAGRAHARETALGNRAAADRPARTHRRGPWRRRRRRSCTGTRSWAAAGRPGRLLRTPRAPRAAGSRRRRHAAPPQPRRSTPRSAPGWCRQYAARSRATAGTASPSTPSGSAWTAARESRAALEPACADAVPAARERRQQLQREPLGAAAGGHQRLGDEHDLERHGSSSWPRASQLLAWSRPSVSRQTRARRAAAAQQRARVSASPALPATSRMPRCRTNSIPW